MEIKMWAKSLCLLPLVICFLLITSGQRASATSELSLRGIAENVIIVETLFPCRYLRNQWTNSL